MEDIYKFRAWNKEEKVMVYDNEDDSEDFWDGVCCSDVSMVNGRLNRCFSSYGWLPYTGKDDSFGKNIYRSDLVKRVYSKEGSEDLIGEVKMHRGRWVISNSEKTLVDLYEEDLYEDTIVGNVYECQLV